MHESCRKQPQLLEIDGAIIGRYRSYEKAAELIASLPESVEQLVATPEKLTELPGIGDRMVEHLSEIVKTGDYGLRAKLLKKYPATILDLLELQSLGPKKVAFLWKTFKAGSVADVEKLAKEGKLRDLAGFRGKERAEHSQGRGSIQEIVGKIPHQRGRSCGVGNHRAHSEDRKNRRVRDAAGSLRRGKETVGDLDLLLTLADGHTFAEGS